MKTSQSEKQTRYCGIKNEKNADLRIQSFLKAKIIQRFASAMIDLLNSDPHLLKMVVFPYNTMAHMLTSVIDSGHVVFIF